MHILATSSVSLDDTAEPVDLGQSAADVAILSFTDSDLSSIAQGWRSFDRPLATLRLVRLRDLRHPMSIDLWIDKVAQYSKIIIVRILGGYDWWYYGCEELSRLCQNKGILLFLLPGEDQEDDSKLAEASTVSQEERLQVLNYFREGGIENINSLIAFIQNHLDGNLKNAISGAKKIPKNGYYLPGEHIVSLETILSQVHAQSPVIPILFYRSMLMATDIAPIDALFGALQKRNFTPVPIFVSSLKDKAALSIVEETAHKLNPAAFITTTAFASDTGLGHSAIFDRIGIPVFQAVIATTRKEVWQDNQRGLNPADLAIHVVLPELDGRIFAGAISFKAEQEKDEAFEFCALVNQPQTNRIEQFANRISAFIRMKETPCSERRLTILVPDYPGVTGRTGYAVGLDVLQSILSVLYDLKEKGYDVQNIPLSSNALLKRLDVKKSGLSLLEYQKIFAELPETIREAMEATWGYPESDSDLQDHEFQFQAACFGKITVALAPERGDKTKRRAEYHNPVIPPRHSLVAFGFWMQKKLQCHALIHMGAHGTLEWLPGKTVALSENCFPEIIVGALPVIYPFIVSNPGEAAVAKRRIAAVTLGHLPPPLVSNTLSDDQQKLERLVDEYAQADGLDHRRRNRLESLILEAATQTGLAQDAGISSYDSSDTALARIDAWLCDLKDFALKDGHHVYGRCHENDEDPLRTLSAQKEKEALLDALDGKHIPPGPSGSPSRGRRDVLPTGRNLFTSDPRTMPTPTAFDIGKQAADEVMRRYIQDHGEPPKNLVLDLWGSASLRTGGEEIAQGLALMGCKPIWDFSTGRITGIEVLPPAMLKWPRVDVTFKISGLFRDMFPALIILLDTAVQSVATRSESSETNPLAGYTLIAGEKPHRIFGPQPGSYGTGIEEQLATGNWQNREELGRTYLKMTSHVYGALEAEGLEAPEFFTERVIAADLLVHTSDDPGRDILEGSADVAYIGGFSAAVAALNGKADIITLDTTNPDFPKARSVREAITRVVHGRALNPKFIDAQMKHGPRGAAELVETVDRLIGFAETTEAVSAHLIEAVFDAYLGDKKVRQFLLDEYPEAVVSIIRRFMDARRRELWRSHKNSIDVDLENFLEEVQQGRKAYHEGL